MELEHAYDDALTFIAQEEEKEIAEARRREEEALRERIE